MTQRHFKIKISIKNCTEVFKEELGPGVIADAIYTIDIPKGKNALVMMTLNQKIEEFRDEYIETSFEEID